MANIFDLSVEEFQAALPELQAQGVDIAPLVREYRRLNSALSPVYGLIDRVRGADADAGRTRANLLPMTSPEGMSGLEAIRSGEAELAVPGGLIGMLEGGAMAADAPAAASAGLMPVEDAPMEALGTAGMAMLGGGALSAPRGALRSGLSRNSDDFFADIKSRHPDVELDIYGSPERGFTIGRIQVPEGQREKGIGTQVMREVIDRADQIGAQINLTPSDAFGGNVGRLRNFYRDLGFVENRGRNKDFSTRESMYRAPQEGILSANRDTTAGAIALPAARNEAEAMARRILEMRAAGRAGDVTDEMMAAADPQYMFNNTPLPMDYESRMGRAIQAGFDVNDEMYRGDAPMQSFNTGRGQREQIGVTMSSRPDVAASYIPPRGEGGIYPLASRGQNDAIIEAGGQNWNVIDPDTVVEFQRDTSPLSDYIPENYFEPYDVMAGTAFTDTNDLSRMFQGYGADRVRFNDLVDRGGSAKYYGPESSMPSDVQMVANPNNVRSRFARFDPEFSHLANLSAANASPGVGLLQMYQQQQLEDRARRRGLLP